MNFLVINASPRTLGNTAKLTNAFLSVVPKENKVKTFNVFDLMPAPCNACGYCKASDGCSKKDLEEFFGYYSESDVIVLATPLYNYTFPAPMKALLDRFQRYYEAKHRRGVDRAFSKPKEAVLIVSAGDDGRIGYEIIKKQLERVLPSVDTKLVASVLVNETDTKPLNEYDINKAKDLIRYI